MDLDLDGKVAVVTGRSKGIELAVSIVHTLAAEGMRVRRGSAYRRRARRNQTAWPSASWPPRSALVEARRLGARLCPGGGVDRHGRLDILVNNVGGVKKLRLSGFLEVLATDDDFERPLQLGFFAALPSNTQLQWRRWSGREAGRSSASPSTRSSTPTASCSRLRGRQGRAARRCCRQAALRRSSARRAIRINSISPGLQVRDRPLARRARIRRHDRRRHGQ